MSVRLGLQRDTSILGPTPGPAHNRLHPDVPAAVTVDPGETVVVDCRDGMDGALLRAGDAAALAAIELGANHPLTGPIAVRGAEPGDVLVVDILEVDPDAEATTAVIPGFGVLGDRFRAPFLVRWTITDGVARSAELPGVAICGRPFLGCIAVAPSRALLERAVAREAAVAGRGGVALGPDSHAGVPAGVVGRGGLRTIPPRENGGNLDIRFLSAGSRVLLPVQVEGALLSLGDPHFAQGDGEVCGTAIEVAATATVRIGLRSAEGLEHRARMPAYEWTEEPRAEPRRWFATTGIPVTAEGENRAMDASLAARNALEELVEWIVAEHGLTAEQAYVLASVAADLRISEAVNVPNVLVSAMLPLDVFE